MIDDNIRYNKKYFEKLLAKLSAAPDTDKKLKLAQTSVNFADTFSTGYFSSQKIEGELVRIAQSIRAGNISDTYIPKSFLHVFTETYTTGGHTRVAERWIEYADQGQTHSVALIGDKEKAIPERLQKAVHDKHGRIIHLNKHKGHVAKAIALRELASNFEYIVLHVHPNDFTPVLAFGTDEFTRPVIFFNHADHRFSVGVSVADLFAELREFGRALSHARRNPKRQFILDGPLDSTKNEAKGKLEARKALNLPEDCKIIMTVGSAFKYLRFAEYDFIAMAEKLVMQIPGAILIAIGPDAKRQAEWHEAEVRSNHRIFAKGSVPHADLFTYFFASDLVLDSFPMSGGVAMLDAAHCGVPMLSLHNPIGQYDYITKTSCYCQNIEEMIDKAVEILSEPGKAEKNVSMLRDELARRNYKESWCQNLENMLEIVPKKHSINYFSDADWKLEEIDQYLENTHNLSTKTKLYLPLIFDLKIVKEQKDRFWKMKIFNKYCIAHFIKKA